MIDAISLTPGGLPLSRAQAVAYAPAMDPTPEDSALMLRYKDGDTAAFETLYRRHNDALYRYLLRLCRHQPTAEDVAARARVGVRTVFRHFDAMESLYAAVNATLKRGPSRRRRTRR